MQQSYKTGKLSILNKEAVPITQLSLIILALDSREGSLGIQTFPIRLEGPEAMLVMSLKTRLQRLSSNSLGKINLPSSGDDHVCSLPVHSPSMPIGMVYVISNNAFFRSQGDPSLGNIWALTWGVTSTLHSHQHVRNRIYILLTPSGPRPFSSKWIFY